MVCGGLLDFWFFSGLVVLIVSLGGFAFGLGLDWCYGFGWFASRFWWLPWLLSCLVWYFLVRLCAYWLSSDSGVSWLCGFALSWRC